MVRTLLAALFIFSSLQAKAIVLTYDFEIDEYAIGGTVTHTLQTTFSYDEPLLTYDEIIATGDLIYSTNYSVEAIWNGSLLTTGEAINRVEWVGNPVISDYAIAFMSFDVLDLFFKKDDIEGSFDINRLEYWQVGDFFFGNLNGNAADAIMVARTVVPEPESLALLLPALLSLLLLHRRRVKTRALRG